MIKRLLRMCPLWGALALIVGGCTLLPLGGGAQGPGHFENDFVAFDYPADWDTAATFFPAWTPGHNSEYDADVVAAVAKRNTDTPFEKFTVSCSVMLRPLPDGSTLEQVMEETYAGMFIAEMVAEEAVTVGEMVGYQRVYKQFHGEPLWQVREVWLEHDGQIAIVHCKSLPNQFEDVQADFDVILNSLEVK